MIVMAGKKELFSFATPIGVGLVEAAANLTQAILFDRPEFILFLGSAGSYGRYEIFDIVESRGATQIEPSFWQRCSYTPMDNAITSEGLDIEHQTMVNSSNYITTCATFSNEYLKRGIALENMEFFAILQVAKIHNIPAGGIFVITNRCDEKAHESYMANVAEAMKRLHAYVQTRFKGVR